MKTEVFDRTGAFFMKKFRISRHRAIRTAAGILLFSFVFLLCYGGFFSERVLPVSGEATRGMTVILDAGHGGEDAGAIGANGSLEKDLNLAITQTLAAYLRAAGVTVIETRTEDKLLYKEEENIKGYRKIYDLKNRLLVSRAHPDAVFISIHMNTFPEAKYWGAQIYYSPNHEGSRALAVCLQGELMSRLQPENHRASKAAGDEIYLLSRAEAPAILIECGFLSNPEENQKLSSEDYRKELSFVLFCGIMNSEIEKFSRK